MKILAGTANPSLAQEVADYLGVPMGQAKVSRFADGEVHVQIKESVRGKSVFVVQSLCKHVNDHLMELLVMIDALRRASAREITAVLPYYSYARQDRQAAPRTPISAKLVADLLTAAGVTRVMAMDLHAGQIQGFFSVPFDHLYATPVLLRAMSEVAGPNVERGVVVSPDAGGLERARHYSKRLGIGLAVIDKRRPKPNVAEVMNVIGEVADRDCFIVDDMIDTAGTLCSAAKALIDNGARSVSAFATHGLFNGPAHDRIDASVLSGVYVTNTIPRNEERVSEKIRVLSVGATIGEAVRRVHGDDSVSSLWE